MKDLSKDQISFETRMDYLKNFKKYEEESVNKINTLENRINFLEKVIKTLKGEIKTEQVDECIKKFECKLCQYKFNKGIELKKHISTVHAEKFKCEYCDEDFNVKWKLELHMQTHENVEHLKCSDCDKTFLLKWRLMRHKRLHENVKIKCCHYFNNEKLCPYETLGCKFRHIESAQWEFQEKCFRKICPYRHNNSENANEDTNEHFNMNIDNLCDQILEAAEVSINREEELLSDSFIDDIMISKAIGERELDENRGEILDTSVPIKYYPNCKNCSEEINDCVECIIKDIRENGGDD